MNFNELLKGGKQDDLSCFNCGNGVFGTKTQTIGGSLIIHNNKEIDSQSIQCKKCGYKMNGNYSLTTGRKEKL